MKITGRCVTWPMLAALLLAACGGGGGSASPPSKYTVGGTVTGLSPGNVVTLQDNGGDTRSVSSNASFTFATAIAFGSAYSVSVSGQPTEQICTVNAGSGTMGAANVTNIQVNCVVKTYTIGGTVSGLQPGDSVVLLDNGGDAATVSSNGAFTFATGLIKGAAYNVTVGTQPSGQNCFVFGSGSGTVATSNVTNVVVQCPFVRTLYTFGFTAEDGSGPEAGVVLGSDGNLYGVTAGGGPNWVNTGNNLGAGIFFKLTPAGAETVTWNFGAGMDGQNPSGDLAVDAGGNFYGTTTAGGLYGDGTVFKMTPTGQETVLWNFGSGTDGQQPFGSVVLGQDGNLYGTTTAGGTYGLGTVFRLTPAGVESVLWSFGATGDGQAPKNRLIQGSDGNLYGTTESGGAFGYGTVYELTLAGAETVLYSFADPATTVSQFISSAEIQRQPVFATMTALSNAAAMTSAGLTWNFFGRIGARSRARESAAPSARLASFRSPPMRLGLQIVRDRNPISLTALSTSPLVL